EFYKSRYVKIANTMRAIDRIATTLADVLAPRPAFAGIAPFIDAFAAAARRKCETLHTDPDIFNVGAAPVAAGAGRVTLPARAGAPQALGAEVGMDLERQAKEVTLLVSRARAPMPKTTRSLLERLEAYRAGARPALGRRVDPHAPLIDHPSSDDPTVG